MKVIVLGKNGMLGRYVYTYLKDRFEVIGTTRDEIDASCLKKGDLHSLDIGSWDVIINCIGLIPQRGEASRIDFVSINSMFPLILQEVCAKHEARLIHVSTDCVFDGAIGGYDELSAHDSTDIYGVSKSLGEPEDATVIRTSIIGEELGRKLSLLEWVRSNAGKTTNGFTNHYWNGITCLQFAKICEYIIDNDMFWKGVKHILSPTAVSKLELIQMISDVFDLDVTVAPHETPKPCDRTLATVRRDVVIDIPELNVQIEDLHKYSFVKK